MRHVGFYSFFWPDEMISSRIEESLVVDDRVRSFTQALLIEAIDASYSMGFVEGIFRASSNPTNGALKIIKEFGKRATKHWFKSTRTSDLQNVRIYESVRVELARSFRVVLLSHLNGVASMPKEKPIVAFISYTRPQIAPIVWG